MVNAEILRRQGGPAASADDAEGAKLTGQPPLSPAARRRRLLLSPDDDRAGPGVDDGRSLQASMDYPDGNFNPDGNAANGSSARWARGADGQRTSSVVFSSAAAAAAATTTAAAANDAGPGSGSARGGTPRPSSSSNPASSGAADGAAARGAALDALGRAARHAAAAQHLGPADVAALFLPPLGESASGGDCAGAIFVREACAVLEEDLGVRVTPRQASALARAFGLQGSGLHGGASDSGGSGGVGGVGGVGDEQVNARRMLAALGLAGPSPAGASSSSALPPPKAVGKGNGGGGGDGGWASRTVQAPTRDDDGGEDGGGFFPKRSSSSSSSASSSSSSSGSAGLRHSVRFDERGAMGVTRGGRSGAIGLSPPPRGGATTSSGGGGCARSGRGGGWEVLTQMDGDGDAGKGDNCRGVLRAPDGGAPDGDAPDGGASVGDDLRASASYRALVGRYWDSVEPGHGAAATEMQAAMLPGGEEEDRFPYAARVFAVEKAAVRATTAASRGPLLEGHEGYEGGEGSEGGEGVEGGGGSEEKDEAKEEGGALGEAKDGGEDGGWASSKATGGGGLEGAAGGGRELRLVHAWRGSEYGRHHGHEHAHDGHDHGFGDGHFGGSNGGDSADLARFDHIGAGGGATVTIGIARQHGGGGGGGGGGGDDRKGDCSGGNGSGVSEGWGIAGGVGAVYPPGAQLAPQQRAQDGGRSGGGGGRIGTVRLPRSDGLSSSFHLTARGSGVPGFGGSLGDGGGVVGAHEEAFAAAVVGAGFGCLANLGRFLASFHDPATKTTFVSPADLGHCLAMVSDKL